MEKPSLNAKLRKQGISEEEVSQALTDKKKEAEKIWKDEEKVNRVLEMALKLCRKLANIPYIGQCFADIPILCMMIHDFRIGTYREVPLASILTGLAALMYLISPIDLIPDAIPIVGMLDDAGVIWIAVQAIHNDLCDYRIWKEEQYENGSE